MSCTAHKAGRFALTLCVIDFDISRLFIARGFWAVSPVKQGLSLDRTGQPTNYEERSPMFHERDKTKPKNINRQGVKKLKRQRPVLHPLSVYIHIGLEFSFKVCFPSLHAGTQ